MFRENHETYYRPDNTVTNHAVTIKRPLKTKEQIQEKKNELCQLQHQLKVINGCIKKQINVPYHLYKQKKLNSQIQKLMREIAFLEQNNLSHKTIHKKKKMKSDKIFDYCKQAICDSLSKNISFLTAEDIAYQLNTHVYLVKQTFDAMNKMGWLSQPQHKHLHDCYRPEDSGWAADIYYITDKAKTELLA